MPLIQWRWTAEKEAIDEMEGEKEGRPCPARCRLSQLVTSSQEGAVEGILVDDIGRSGCRKTSCDLPNSCESG